MKEIDDRSLFIQQDAYSGNKEIETAYVTKAIALTAGAFEGCSSLKQVYFGLDIARIGDHAFADCENLTDVYFAIIDADKLIEIASTAFEGCKKEIVFHIGVSALKHPYLNAYAKRHGFRVTGML